VAGFDDFANFDVEKFLKTTEEQAKQLEELQQRAAELIGRAEDKDKLVMVEYSQRGLHELQLNPRAMRLASADLADLIKTVTREAAHDLESKTNELLEDVFGENNPMKMLGDPEKALAQVREAEAAYDRTFDEVMAKFDQIRRQLGS
jgi:DNA-binding protein YbaB